MPLELPSHSPPDSTESCVIGRYAREQLQKQQVVKHVIKNAFLLHEPQIEYSTLRLKFLTLMYLRSSTALLFLTTLILSVQDERESMVKRIQNAGTEVVEAKAGSVSYSDLSSLIICTF